MYIATESSGKILGFDCYKVTIPFPYSLPVKKDNEFKMFENEMIENLQEMRKVAEKEFGLLSHVLNDSIATTFGQLTEKQLNLSTQCRVVENAIVALDTLLKVNELLTTLQSGGSVPPIEYGEY